MQLFWGLFSQVAGLFKKDQPHIVNVHCIAHRFALAASQAAPKVPSLEQVKSVLTQLFYYYRNSPVRTAGLASIEVKLAPERHMK